MPAWSAIRRRGCPQPAILLEPQMPFCFLLKIWSPECEVESRAFVYGGFRPDATAVSEQYTLHRRQPDSGSLKFVHAVQPLKSAAQFSCVCHGEPCARIAHRIHALSIALRDSEFDAGFGLFAREFPCVAQ